MISPMSLSWYAVSHDHSYVNVWADALGPMFRGGIDADFATILVKAYSMGTRFAIGRGLHLKKMTSIICVGSI